MTAVPVAFRKKLRRDKMLSFFAAQSRCVVAMDVARHEGWPVIDGRMAGRSAAS